MRAYTVSECDYLQAMKVAMPIPTQWLVPLVCLLASTTAGFVSAGFAPEGEYLTARFVVALLFANGAVIAGILIAGPARQRRVYRQSKTFQSPLTVEFDDNELRFRTSNGSFVTKWSDVFKVKQNDNLILIYESSVLMRIVKTEAFESEEERNRFKELLRSTQCGQTR